MIEKKNQEREGESVKRGTGFAKVETIPGGSFSAPEGILRFKHVTPMLKLTFGMQRVLRTEGSLARDHVQGVNRAFVEAFQTAQTSSAVRFCSGRRNFGR